MQPQVQVVHEQRCPGVWQGRGNAPVRRVRRHDEAINEDELGQQVRGGLGRGAELPAVMAEECLGGLGSLGELTVEVGAVLPFQPPVESRSRRRQQEREPRHEQQGETHADAAKRIPHDPSRWGSSV